MGDRCHIELHCYKKDAGRFENIGFTDQRNEDLPDGICHMVDEEANHAHYTELSQLKKIFFGSHGAGYAYDAYRFVCDGNRYLAVPVSVEGNLVVSVNASGDPLPGDVAAMKRYMTMVDKVSRSMKMEGKGGLWKKSGQL